MKYLNFRRFALNVGMLLLLAAAILLCISLVTNLRLKKSEGLVIGEEKSDTALVQSSTGEKTYPFSDYTIEYFYDGVRYERTMLRDTGEYSVGDTVRFEIDPKDPGSYTYNTFDSDIIPIVMLSVPGLVLFILFRGALNGYREEFVLRYKKALIYTFISAWIPVIWYFTAVLHPAPAELFEGLGEAVFFLFLLVLVPVVDVIVWICAAVSYARKMKKAETAQ